MPGSILSPEDTVFLDDGESMTLLTSTRHVIVLKDSIRLALGPLLESDLSANYPRLAGVWTQTSDGQWPDLSISREPKTTQSPLTIESPKATAITVTRPSIVWKAPAQIVGISLRLEILTSNGVFDEVEQWNNVRTRTFQFSQPLRKGRFYQIVIEKGAFKDATSIYVLDDNELNALSNAKETFEKQLRVLNFKNPNERILKARWLDEHGLIEQATKEWTALKELFPNMPNFKKEVLRHQNRKLTAPNELRSLERATKWLLELAPIFLPIR